MIDALPDSSVLIRSLAGVLCPACGGKKKARQTFCGKDYFKLSKTMRSALYNRVGEGYEEAITAAIEKLGVLVPHWPS